MRRRLLPLIATFSLLPALMAAAPPPSAPPTGLSMTFMDAVGSAAMAGAHVVVFFVRPAPGLHQKVSLPQVGSGITNSAGQVSLTLNTSPIPASALGDVGSGDVAFNSMIIAWDGSGQYNITDQVINEGHALSLKLRAGTDPATGKPALLSAAQVASLDSYFSNPDAPAYQIAEGSDYRYSPITPLNSAPGLRAALDYTYTTSVARQSEFELPTNESGGISLTGNQMEEKDRTVSTGIHERGRYHRWIWADYNYVYYLVIAAAVHGKSWYQWEPDHFQGTVSDDNPQHPFKKKTIGHVSFRQPAYHRGPDGNWAVRILPSTEPWTRSNGTRQENDLGVDFTMGPLPEGDIGTSIHLEDLMTYATITSVTWTYINGCPDGDTRVIWGHHTDPVAATRVMASCVPKRIS
jgi:hypothetical protein